MSLIIGENISFSYNGNIIVENLNFSIENGDYFSIIGENGAGKSTLMKGLLKLKTPSKGRIYTGEGLKLTEIGYLSQQSQFQKDFPACVFEIVLSGFLNNLKWRPFYNKTEKKMAEEKLEQLNIKNLKNKCYSELSGGQQQRVLLARALCSGKKILFLDEPVVGLDPIAVSEFYDLIANINKEQKLTIVMVSHDIENVISYSSKILHLADKKQLFYGTPKEYIKTPIGEKFSKGGIIND